MVAVVLELQRQSWVLRFALVVKVGRQVFDVILFVIHRVHHSVGFLLILVGSVAGIVASDAVKLARVPHHHQSLVHVTDALVHIAVGFVSLSTERVYQDGCNVDVESLASRVVVIDRLRVPHAVVGIAKSPFSLLLHNHVVDGTLGSVLNPSQHHVCRQPLHGAGFKHSDGVPVHL